MENSPKTLSKVYLALQLSRVCSLIVYSSNSAAKKSYCLQNKFYCLCNWNFPWWEGENSSFDITLMREHIPVWLQLEKISPFPKTNKRFYRCRSIPLFFDMYCTCRETYFHDNTKSDDVYFMARCSTTRSAWTFKLKFFEMRITTCSGNDLFAENKLYKLYNMKVWGLSVEDICVEKSSTPPVWIFFWNSLFEVVFILNLYFIFSLYFTFAVFCYHGATVTLWFHYLVY